MRSTNSTTRLFKANVAKIFCNCSRRKRLFRELTGWHLSPAPFDYHMSFIASSNFLGQRFFGFQLFLQHLASEEPNDTVITKHTDLMSHATNGQLSHARNCMFSRFFRFCTRITKLQERMSLCEKLGILKKNHQQRTR